MSYAINGTALSTLGFTAGRAENSNVAISGIFDMPARDGKYYHEWPDDAGIEPYVDEADLRWKGRDLKLYGYIIAETDQLADATLFTLTDFFDSLTDIATLTCAFGSWQVYVRDEIETERIGKGVLSLQINFREPVVDLDIADPWTEYVVDQVQDRSRLLQADGWDGISFASLGLQVLTTEDYRNRPSTKSFTITHYDAEAYKHTPIGVRKLKWTMWATSADYATFQAKMNLVLRMFTKAGLVYITNGDAAMGECFCPEGYKVTDLWIDSDQVRAKLEIVVWYEGYVRILEPINFEAVVYDADTNRVTWTNQATADEIMIYRSDTIDGDGVLVGTVAGTATEFLDEL